MDECGVSLCQPRGAYHAAHDMGGSGDGGIECSSFSKQSKAGHVKDLRPQQQGCLSSLYQFSFSPQFLHP